MKQILTFKTNLDCQNCVAKVKPFLDKIKGLENWSIDINNPDKLLTTEVSDTVENEIINAIESVGFDIEKV